MIKPLCIFITLLFISIRSDIIAATYYVDINGNDSNSGKTPASAWNTISKVNSSKFNSGDTISFKAGSRFIVTEPLSSKNNITFNSYGNGARPIIDGDWSHICVKFEGVQNINFTNLKFVNGYPCNITFWKCNQVLIDYCNIDSSKGASIYNCNIYSGQGSYLTVRNSTINYGEQSSDRGNLGIYLDGTDNTLLERDTLLNNFSNIRIGFGNPQSGNSDWTDNLIVRYCIVKYGIYDNIDDDGSRNSQFYYNVFETNTSDGFHDNVYLFSDGSGNYSNYAANGDIYYNNTFITHAGGGSAFDIQSGVKATNIIIKNNIFYNTDRWGWFFYSDNTYGTWTFDNNIYFLTAGGYDHSWHIYDNALTNFNSWQDLGYDLNSKYADPLFNNYLAGDYSLQIKSPAINAGTYLGLTTDIKGNSVPSNYPDLGAYQHIIQNYITLNLKVFLEGLYNNGSMSTFFNSHNLIPLSQPYNISPWNYNGSESVSKIPSDIVNWILIELRSVNSNYNIIARHAAFLKSNGTITDLDGTSPLKFMNVNNGYYYIVIKYLNSIETWSKNGGVALTDAVISYDFTSAQSQAYDNNLVNVGSKWCVYSGDIKQDGIILESDCAGIDNDKNYQTYNIINDLNGDGVVDMNDMLIFHNNNSNWVARILPPGAN